MLFQKTQTCLSEAHYLTVQSAMNIMATNGAKMAQLSAAMFLGCYCLPLVGKGLLQAHNDKCCSLVKLLCIYFCYIILLNHG